MMYKTSIKCYVLTGNETKISETLVSEKAPCRAC